MDQTDSTNKPYNLSTIYAISENNPRFLNQLITVFVNTVTVDLQLMRDAAAAGNWQEVGQLAHKIKPSLTHFGITSLTGIILALERPVNYDPENLNKFVAELNHLMQQVLTGLRAEFPDIFNN